MKRTTMTTSPGRRGSRRCARVRMVVQDTTANPIETERRRRKVTRQSSRWRFSNRSRREEIVGRLAPPAGESLAEPGENSSFLGMETRAAPGEANPEAPRVAQIIVEIARGHGNDAHSGACLNGTDTNCL